MKQIDLYSVRNSVWESVQVSVWGSVRVSIKTNMKDKQ